MPCLYGILSLSKTLNSGQEGTFHVHATRTRPAVEVSADGTGVVSHAGSRLIADLADQTTLTAQLSAAFAHRPAPQTAHDPGRVLTDVAVMLADGGECISDIATLADQSAVFGPVASDSTCWRLLNAITSADLEEIAQARAGARAVAWAQRAEQSGHALPASLVAGMPLLDGEGRPVLVIDDDATIVVTHSEKERTAATFKHSYGYHPVLAFCDNSNEALAGILRPGNAGSNTAADHIALLDAALAQIPDEYRHGYPKASEAEIQMLAAAEQKHGSPPHSLEHAKNILGIAANKIVFNTKPCRWTGGLTQAKLWFDELELTGPLDITRKVMT